ncbi:MAG: glycine/betaine ABC transporter substrate-binding protein [Hyphomicrobiales bacterium]|nr:MAG: glycine/betaine ABC transporter substrate-binding protein [Hyphomicrobiales bacterium]
MRRLLIAAAFGLALPAAASAADCGEVTLTEMNWASSAVVSHVSKFLMEQGYGCKVKLIPSSTVPALASVAETGKPDIVTELWINGAPSYNELQAAGKIETLTDVLSDGGVEGWWIPTYLVKAHPELASIEGVLANPGLLENRFHNCPEGWGCLRTNTALSQAFDLKGNGFEIFQHGSGETMATSIAAAYESKKPWFGYYWAPTSVLGKYDMTSVDLGPYDEKIHACNSKPGCEEVGKSSYPVGPVKTIVTTEFSTKHPEISALMKNVSFTNAQMGALLSWQEEKKASAEEVAVHFLSTSPDVWKGWINEEAAGKLSALLK